MKTTASDALICVDVQNDFCFGGALPVPQGEHVSGPLNRAILKFETIVLTRDWHPADHCSFSDAPTCADGIGMITLVALRAARGKQAVSFTRNSRTRTPTTKARTPSRWAYSLTRTPTDKCM